MFSYQKMVALFSRQQRKQLPKLLLLVTIGMLLETCGVGFIIPVFTLIMQPDFMQRHEVLVPWLQAFGEPTYAQLIIVVMLMLLGIYLFKNAFIWLMSWKQNKFIFAFQAELSTRLFHHYLHQSWAFHLRRNSAQLISHISKEVNYLITYVLQAAIMIVTEGFILCGLLILLLCVEFWGTSVVIIALGGCAWMMQRFISKHLIHWGGKRQQHDVMIMQQLQQGLGGVKEVKTLGRELYFVNQFNQHSQGSACGSRWYRTFSELPRLLFELLAVMGLVILVVVMLSQGYERDALLAVLGLFAAAVFRIIPSLNRILGALQNLRYGSPVINTLYDELKTANEHETVTPVSVFEFNQVLSLQDVSFAYADEQESVLKRVNVTISKGTTVGFVGLTGSGKSTLIDLILGLLMPNSGCICVDDVNIQTNLRGWQNKIGYVAQTIFLNDDTVRRNIAFGIPDELIDDEMVWQALKLAQLDELIQRLPEGLDTLVGERGVRLSGGQRQRIGIARALYSNPAVLVLDEATNALDEDTESAVMQAIHALHGQKTILIIAHRLSTLVSCDGLYRVEQGCVSKTTLKEPYEFSR